MAQVSNGLTLKIESLTPRGVWMTGVLLAAAVVVVVCSIMGLALRGSAMWVGWQPILLAAGVVVIVPVIGLGPLGLCDPADSKRISKAAYSGTPIRMVTAMALGLPVLLSLGNKGDRVAFGVWLGGLYMVSLLAEMVVLAVWLRGRGGGTRV